VTIKFGTFLLMQSPSARPSQEMYSRAIEMAQAAEALGFNNVWLAEHHFSTYGYLSRPAQFATYIAAKTTRLRVGTAVMSLRNHYERVERGRAIPVPAAKEPDIDDLLDRFLVIGTPDTCIRQITRIRELVGITHFNCSFWFGDLEQARVLRSMELFAREVMPAFG
jgi:alkanesulfonate monooxygenase SsuD/methylene tetrahydromethanopterin reductase-like flavin-dependent oxidoreductase (luciferase family)